MGTLQRICRLAAMAILSLSGVASAQSATSTTLNITSNGSAVTTVASQTAVALTATVLTGSAPVTPGQVNFCDATAANCTGLHLLGTAQLTGLGTATLKFVPGIGTHSYKAVYVGTNATVSSASASASLTVTGLYPTTTALTSSGTPGNYTLTATVTGTGAVPALPTGSISFQDTTNANAVLGTASLIPGTSTFGFVNSSTIATGSTPHAVVAGDFNSDGYMDLAIVNQGGSLPTTPGSLTILLGHGDGTFTAAASPATGIRPLSIAAADLNSDGNLDLVVVNNISQTLTVLMGNGDGTFTAKPDIALGTDPDSVAIGDFNGDGIPDLAVVDNIINGDGIVQILLGNGDGTFTAGTSIDTGTGSTPSYVITGDFNNDGITDLAVSTQNIGTIIYRGQGDGTFTAVTPTITAATSAVGAADFNGDGNADLVFLTAGIGSNLAVYLGNGNGTFTAQAGVLAGNHPGVGIADFNGDGNLDIATADLLHSEAHVLLGNGNGNFTEMLPDPPAGSGAVGIAVGDFNGDGLPDIAATDYNGNTVTILLSQYTTTATATLTGVDITGSGMHLVDAVYPGDTNYSPSISTTIPLTALPITPTGTVTVSPEPSVYYDTFTLTATVTAPSSSTTTPTGTVTFSIDGVVAGTGTLASGVATFTEPAGNTITAGTHTITAVYSGDSNFSTATFTGSHTVSKAPSVSTLTVTPGTVYFGQEYNGLGSAYSSVGDTLTGVITFLIDGTVFCSLTVDVAATCPAMPFADFPNVGSHVLTTSYTGDANNLASTSTPITLTVVPDPTTTSITANNYAPIYGQTLTLTATVTGNYSSPTGTVSFYDGTTLLGTGTLTAIGNGLTSTATFTTTTLNVGTHTITVSYGGSLDFLPSASTAATITVLPQSTVTTLIGVSNPSYVGLPVIFTATVTGNNLAPTGTVIFTEAFPPTTLILQLGTATLVPSGNGLTSTATFTTSTLPVGTDTILASFTGSTDFAASNSAPYPEVILPAPVAVADTVTLASSLNPAGYGQTVIFTTAIAAAPGATQPANPATGTVSFYDGATLLSTSTVDPTTGIATFNTASLAVGSHVITAQYSGDSYYLAGASNTIIEVIHVPYTGPPDFTLTIAQNPFIVGVGLLSSTQITVTAINGWTNDVTLACPSNLPYETTCTLQQTTIAGGNGATTLILSTISPHDCGSSAEYFTGRTAQLEMRLGAATLAGLVIFILPRKRRVMKGLLLAVLCVLPGIVGCAGHCTDLGTRPGTYTIPITATGVGTTTTHTVDLQMQVNL